MSLRLYNDFVSRAAAGYRMSQPIYDYTSTAPSNSSTWGTGNSNSTLARVGTSKALPNPLPSGVTAYIIPRYTIRLTTAQPVIIAKLISLGTFDVSGASGTWTNGSVMPSAKVLGVSNTQLASAVIMEVTTALSANQGTFTLTYTNQSGTASQTSQTVSPPNSAPLKSCCYLGLASGDWGVQAITGGTRTGGTTPTGVITCWGLVPIGIQQVSGFATYGGNLLTNRVNPLRLGAGDKIGVFCFSHQGAARATMGEIEIVGDN